MKAANARLALGSLLAMLLVSVWAWWLERPPRALPATAPEGRFAAGRALDHLEEIAARPHMPGSAEHDRVRAYIVGALEALGLATEIHETTVVLPLGRVVRAATVRSIVARLPGTDSSGGVALAAHYDSQQLAPGAGDDGAGAAAILEALRALRGGGAMRNDLYVLITDAEELGLIGARGFVGEHRWWPEIRVLMSFEARGSAGQSVMFETNAENGWVVREFARADPHPSGSSLFYEIYRRLPNDTDFSVYKRAGVVGLNFAIAEGADRYHRPTDTVENLSLDSLQHHGEHALALARHFGELDVAAAIRAPDVVFFRVPGLGLVSYANHWVVPLTLAAWLFAGWVAAGAYRRGRLSAAGVVVGLIVALLSGAAAAGLGWLLWRAVRGFHHELGSIAGRALYDESWYMLAIVCIAVATLALTFSVARRWFGIVSLATGAALVPLVGALAAARWAPGVNMLLLWPAVFAVGAIRCELSRPRDATKDAYDLAALVLLSIPVIVMLFPLVWTLYIGLNISAAAILAVACVLLLIHLLPLFDSATQAHSWWLPSLAGTLAVLFVAVGVATARPGPRRPVPADLVYAFDRERGAALWGTLQPGPDGWVERFVGPDAVERDLPEFLAGNRRPYRVAAAPVVASGAPDHAILADVTEGRVRRVRLSIRSALGPELMNVSPSTAGPWSLRAVNGTDVDAQAATAAGTASAAPEGGDWLLQHWGTPPGGTLTLDLETADLDATLDLILVEFVMSLPRIDELDPARPPGVVAHGGRLTDVSMFRQVIRVD